jgi:mono/diheme cytochrome c family protein
LDQAKRLATSPPPICEISDIITYGRPGTPMAAWGVDGGGPKNAQAIADLVAYILSIQLTPEEAQQQATEAIEAARATEGSCPQYMSCPGIAVTNAEETLAASREVLDEERVAIREALQMPGADDAALRRACEDLQADLPSNPNELDERQREQALACGTYLKAADDVDQDEAALAWALEWQRRRANVSDGQLVFEYACARCHTEGWSVFDPTVPPGDADSVDVLGLAGGGGGTGGGIGFNLRNGSEMARFGSDEEGGWQAQVDFVGAGSDPFKLYGDQGQGSGKMPGFAEMLTPDQLKQVVSYERYCLDVTTFDGVTPRCETPTAPRTPPTTTTIAGA